MKKVMPTLMICMILAGSPVLVPALAKKGNSDQSGKSNMAHLYLYEKDANWQIVEDGAWGKLTYRLKGKEFWFRFEGHGLETETSYSLIYYADPWPGSNPGAFIASGETDEYGDINIKGSVELDMDLPDSGDDNYPAGAKIWLVLSSDYDESSCSMKNFNRPEYLFENNLITYDDTDVPPP